MTTTNANAMPDPDDVSRGLAALEQFAQSTAPVLESVAAELPTPVPVEGETKRVRALRAQTAEARLLAELQADETPLELDSPRVRKMRRKAAEAAKLHDLAQDPKMRAYKAARARRMFTIILVSSLALALGWSTAGVQKFAADDAAVRSAAWWFAWAVEPFLSLGLLGVVGSRSYMAIQGSPLTGEAEKTAKRIEWVFLGLSLGMNAFPYLPGVAEPFDLDRLVLHILGPIVAVMVVVYLSIHLKGFNDLRLGGSGTGGTGPAYRENVDGQYTRDEAEYAPERVDLDALVAWTRHLIAIGRLPEQPGVHKIRRELECGTDIARQVRDALAGGA